MMMFPGHGFFFAGALPFFLLVGAGVATWYVVRRSRTSHETGVQRSGSGYPQVKRPAQSDIYRLAKRYNGILTVTTVVIELNIEPAMAEELLQEAVDGIRVHMDVGSDGTVKYRFSEIIDNG